MRWSALLCVRMLACGGAFSAQPAGPDAVRGQPTSVQGNQSAATAPMGRMFFTPAERAALDESRRRPVPVPAPESEVLPPAPSYVTLDGVVRRSDGATSIWLNSGLVEGRRTADGLEVTGPKSARAAGRITVRVPQAGRSVDLRVGQQLEVTSGQVRERYQLTPTSAVDAPQAAAPTAEKIAPRPKLRHPVKKRGLLREIEGPADDRPDQPAVGKG